jgi:hypothetical protein
MSPSLQQQISSIKSQIITKKRMELKDPTLSPMRWAADGEDHINVWEHASSPLGKLLAHSSPHSFKHRYFGKFNSMESFWHYIQSEERDDRIRVMHGPTLRAFIKRIKMTKITNFRAIIMDSNWQRIRQHRDWMDRIAASSLPFDCYYISKDTQIRTRPTFFKWLIMGFEEIRTAIKDGREPCFDFLLDHTGSSIYQFVLPTVPVATTPVAVTRPTPRKQILSHRQAQSIIDALDPKEPDGNIITESNRNTMPCDIT